MNRKYNRPIVKQISKQWVSENCKYITERDIGLLKLLQKRRILRRDQIERLYPEFASTDSLNKRLKTLYTLHVIDRCYPPVGLGEGSSKQHICLDKAGIILLGLEKYNKPIVDNKLFMGWEHKVLLNEYECNIKDILHSIGYKCALYSCEQPYYYKDKKIIPDIFVMALRGNKGKHFFIEVDRGTEDLPYLKKKIDSYIELYLSKSWLLSPWAKILSKPSFPRVLVLTEETLKKRQITLKDYIEKSPLMFKVGSHQELEELLQKSLEG